MTVTHAEPDVASLFAALAAVATHGHECSHGFYADRQPCEFAAAVLHDLYPDEIPMPKEEVLT